MIQERDTKNLASADEPLGYLSIRQTRFWIPRWVVVHHDHRRCGHAKGRSIDLTRVNRSGGQGPLPHESMPLETMAGIQIEGVEGLDLEPPEVRSHEPHHGGRVLEGRSGPISGTFDLPSQGEGRRYPFRVPHCETAGPRKLGG